MINGNLYTFIRAHGLDVNSFINLVNITHHHHVSNELNESYEVIECRYDQLSTVEEHTTVKCIVVHIDDDHKSKLMLNNSHAVLYVLIGTPFIPSFSHPDVNTRAYIYNSKVIHYIDSSDSTQIGKYQPTKEVMNVYEYLYAKNICYSEPMEIWKSSGQQMDDEFKHIITLRSDIVNANEKPDKSQIVEMVLKDGGCTINKKQGLFIIHGKIRPGIKKRVVTIEETDDETQRDVTNFAILFADMTQEEIDSIEENQYYFGYDTMSSPGSLITGSNRLDNVFRYYSESLNAEFGKINNIFGLTLDEFTAICSSKKCDVFLALSYINSYLMYAFDTGAKVPDGSFKALMIKTGFYIPEMMNITTAKQYEYVKERREMLKRSKYLKPPYIKEITSFDAELAARYDIFIKGEISLKSELIKRIKRGFHGKREIEMLRNLKIDHGDNALDLYEIEESDTFGDSIEIIVDTNSCIKNVTNLNIVFQSDVNLVVEDCVYVIIEETEFNGTVIISGNVHTLVNMSNNVVVRFINIGQTKNLVSSLISERGSSNDHFSAYTKLHKSEMAEYVKSQNLLTIESKDIQYDEQMPIYKSAVIRFFYYNKDTLHPSMKLAEIDEIDMIY